MNPENMEDVRKIVSAALVNAGYRQEALSVWTKSDAEFIQSLTVYADLFSFVSPATECYLNSVVKMVQRA